LRKIEGGIVKITIGRKSLIKFTKWGLALLSLVLVGFFLVYYVIPVFAEAGYVRIQGDLPLDEVLTYRVVAYNESQSAPCDCLIETPAVMHFCADVNQAGRDEVALSDHGLGGEQLIAAEERGAHHGDQLHAGDGRAGRQVARERQLG